MDYITAKHSSIVIPNYELGSCKAIENLFSIWNDTKFKLEPRGYRYNEETKQLVLPRAIDLNYVEKVLNSPIEVDYKPDDYSEAVYNLLKEPRNDLQRNVISFLIGENEYDYTKRLSQLCLDLETDSGKTYCVVAALTFLRVKSIIITHADKIKKQWYNTFKSMTNLAPEFICDISGSNLIDALKKFKDPKYKVYLINHQTIQSYAKKNGWDSIGELFNHLKVGVKVIDEAHLLFDNTLNIDFYTNTKKTFYLTANFERSSVKEKKLFNTCFAAIAKFGKKKSTITKRKHVIYVGIIYNSKPSLDVQASMKNFHGFDRNKFCDYQMKDRTFFEALKFTLDYFKKFSGKTMLISTKIESTEIIKEYIENLYSDKIISTYNSTNNGEDTLKADIISTTFKSAGTGFDLPGLRVCTNVEPYSSEITANQITGRLREYSPTDYTFYVELVDKGFERVYKMYKHRVSKVFKDKCYKLTEIIYNK